MYLFFCLIPTFSVFQPPTVSILISDEKKADHDGNVSHVLLTTIVYVILMWKMSNRISPPAESQQRFPYYSRLVNLKLVFCLSLSHQIVSHCNRLPVLIENKLPSYTFDVYWRSLRTFFSFSLGVKKILKVETRAKRNGGE